LKNGTVIEGVWTKEGEFVGHRGTFPDGVVYEGEMKDDKPHGRGIKSWKDGRKYDGMWVAGHP